MKTCKNFVWVYKSRTNNAQVLMTWTAPVLMTWTAPILMTHTNSSCTPLPAHFSGSLLQYFNKHYGQWLTIQFIPFRLSQSKFQIISMPPYAVSAMGPLLYLWGRKALSCYHAEPRLTDRQRVWYNAHKFWSNRHVSQAIQGFSISKAAERNINFMVVVNCLLG